MSCPPCSRLNESGWLLVLSRATGSTLKERNIMHPAPVCERKNVHSTPSQLYGHTLLSLIGPLTSSREISSPRTTPFWRISHSPRSRSSQARSRIAGMAALHSVICSSSISVALRALAISDGQNVFGGSLFARNVSICRVSGVLGSVADIAVEETDLYAALLVATVFNASSTTDTDVSSCRRWEKNRS